MNLSVCFTVNRDCFPSIRSVAELAVRFYNRCVLEPLTLQKTVMNAAALWPVVFSRLEHGKFNTVVPAFRNKKCRRLRTIAQSGGDKSNSAPFVRFPHIYFTRLADKGALIRARGSQYKLYHPLFREFLQQQE